MAYTKQSSVSPTYTKQAAAAASHTQQIATDPTETSIAPVAASYTKQTATDPTETSQTVAAASYTKQTSADPTETSQASVSALHTKQVAADPTETSAAPAGEVKSWGETKWTAWLPDSEENIAEMDVLEFGQYLGAQSFVWEFGMNTQVFDSTAAVTPTYTKQTAVTP